MIISQFLSHFSSELSWQGDTKPSFSLVLPLNTLHLPFSDVWIKRGAINCVSLRKFLLLVTSGSTDSLVIYLPLWEFILLQCGGFFFFPILCNYVPQGLVLILFYYIFLFSLGILWVTLLSIQSPMMLINAHQQHLLRDPVSVSNIPWNENSPELTHPKLKVYYSP